MHQASRYGTVFGLAIAALALGSALASAAERVPDLKGKWVGKTHTIVAGGGGHWPTGSGTFAKPGLFEKDLVIEVTGQEGRRFWGVTTLSGKGEKTDEPFIGELTGRGNRTIVGVDTDGFYNGQVVGAGKISFCYTHAGGKTASSVVSCTEVTRAR
jgi:hypothetical protein